MKSGNLNLLEPFGPHRACYGTALIFTFYFEIETSPEKSEKMEFLGQDPVRCEIIVDDKCLQLVKKKLNISVVKFPMKIKKKYIFNKNLQNLLQHLC